MCIVYSDRVFPMQPCHFGRYQIWKYPCSLSIWTCWLRLEWQCDLVESDIAVKFVRLFLCTYAQWNRSGIIISIEFINSYAILMLVRELQTYSHAHCNDSDNGSAILYGILEMVNYFYRSIFEQCRWPEWIVDRYCHIFRSAKSAQFLLQQIRIAIELIRDGCTSRASQQMIDLFFIEIR